ncbi:unnamed protein product [Parnassius apollo]|uniref:(apollo) hypothetical protein n=1 Tax=Parnassius apollo TaxID=110799 RepID=A0A8S3XFK5_PARAO|nr:unnamed protein product [Parnassius apollo]
MMLKVVLLLTALALVCCQLEQSILTQFYYPRIAYHNQRSHNQPSRTITAQLNANEDAESLKVLSAVTRSRRSVA